MRRAVLRELGLVLALFLVAGALAGALWHTFWNAPDGVAYDGTFRWDPAALDDAFQGTGLYLLIAAGLGLVLGVVCTLIARTDPLWTLAAVLLGAVAGGLTMAGVGYWLGPPDPDAVASRSVDLTRITRDLVVSGTSAYLAMPLGATVGSLLILLTTRPAGDRPSRDRPSRDRPSRKQADSDSVR